MHDDTVLALATCRLLMVEPSADKIQLPPPPPAAETESAIMWHPADRLGDVERIPLSGDDDRSAALLASVWLGGQVLELNRPDPKVEEEDDDTDRDQNDPQI